MLDVFRTREELKSPTDLQANAVKQIAPALKNLMADVFALYLKTKNFHWHMSGSHFRDYHLLLDAQADQSFCDDRRDCRTHPDRWDHDSLD